jgi:hypothetical protein
MHLALSLLWPLLGILAASPRALEVAKQHPGEKQLLVVDSQRYQLALFERGKLVQVVEIGLGQGHGPKVEKGDLKTPRGTYFIIDKQHGNFGGQWGEYYGGYWIKLNYPGPDDAARGLSQGWIDEDTAAQINDAWSQRKLTPQNTRLGGGVGLHGWAGEWDGRGGAHLSFGCVVLHNADMAALFERIQLGARVILL